MSGLWIFDTEGNGLEATLIHCLSATCDGEIFSTTDYDEMREFLLGADTLVAHNCIRWDIPTLERILQIKIEARLIDTLATSWTLEPKRNRHGLAYHGEDFGIPKPKVDDWVGLTSEEYIHRCEEDVKINWKLWLKHEKYLKLLYENDPEGMDAYLDYLSFKMDCARKQEESGWKVDLGLVKETIEQLEIDREARIQELFNAMPNVPIVQTKTYPAKPLKKDGTLSAHGLKWQEFLVEQGLPITHKLPVEYISGYDPPNPGSHKQVKDWLFSLGWKPKTFKYKKDNETGKLRDIPQINKEHGEGICDSIVDLYEDHPELQVLDGLSVISHRLPLLKGFLENADDKGYIKAEVQGLTNTLRFQHKTVVNLPKVNRPYGEQIRGSLIASEGEVLCGSDMASLEDRLKQHFIYKFDPQFVANVNKPGYDPHLELAVMGRMITREQADGYEQNKKQLKPIRDIAKNGNYSCQYGAGPPRIAITAGISLAQAKVVHKAYWDLNWGIKAVAEDQTVKTLPDINDEGSQMWLLNPINGFWYSLREMKDIFSTLVQGTASYAFDLWLGFVLEEYPHLTAQFHDEGVWRIEDNETSKARIEKILKDAINSANEFLKLDRDLGIDIQYGYRYSEIH